MGSLYADCEAKARFCLKGAFCVPFSIRRGKRENELELYRQENALQTFGRGIFRRKKRVQFFDIKKLPTACRPLEAEFMRLYIILDGVLLYAESSQTHNQALLASVMKAA